MGLPCAEECIMIMLSRFNTIAEGDRQPAGKNSYRNIARQHCCVNPVYDIVLLTAGVMSSKYLGVYLRKFCKFK